MSRKSISIARSELAISQHKYQLTKSQIANDERSSNLVPQWYQSKCVNLVNQIPSTFPLLRNSMPFRLFLEKVSGLTTNKKSANSHSYLRLMVSFVSSDLTIIGKTCFHQCQLPIQSDGRFTDQICFYYHSRINKSLCDVKLIIRFDLANFKDGIVQSVTNEGIFIITSPFQQSDGKNINAFKGCSQLDLIMNTKQKFPNANLSFSYRLQSNIQLKNFIKFIPSQYVVSSQTHIAGLASQYLPNNIIDPIEQQDMVFVNVGLCQIHIPEKFEQAVLAQIKEISKADKIINVSQRKIVIGFHNQYQLVTPTTRILQWIGKQATGEATVAIYQGLSGKQTMKLPYYYNQSGDETQTLALSLIYCCGQNQYEAAIFSFKPNLNGEQQEVSESMITGNGVGIYSTLLPIKISKYPTIIFQYQCEQQTQRILGNDGSKQNRRLKSQHRLSLKYPGSNEESSKRIQELQQQRFNLERQKQELDRMKTNQYISYQEDFEKKLEDERDKLRIRQESIQRQYRDEVQKQIKMKADLQYQLRLMKQKISALQKQQNEQRLSPKLSYENTPREASEEMYGNTLQPNIPVFRQKVNPNYLIDQEHTLPINQVRQIMAKTFQTNNDLIEKQLKNFNYASKFTFVFNSIVWSASMSQPKSFYLVIRFFNCKEFISDPLCYIDQGHQYHQLVRLNNYNLNMDNSTPSYEFIVDPSSYANPEQAQADLTYFLSKNNTIIDIFDASNYLYLGQINIKMNQLFKGSKSQVMIAKQYHLAKLKSDEDYGIIQVLIKNQSIQCKQPICLIQKKLVKQTKKKIVSNNPMLLTNDILNQKSNIQILNAKNQAKNRQQKRIQMYKKKIIQKKETNNNFNDFSMNDKNKVISKINAYKEKKMPQIIKKIYENLLTEIITINPYFGQAETFVYQFTNMSQSPSSFKVTIQTEEDVLSLVKNPLQWKYFVMQNGYPVPKLYDCVNEENSFFLAPGETIPLIFKYLSYNKQLAQSKTSIAVTVTKEENNWISGGFTLNIESHQSIVNHSYILYQPGNQMIDIIIPVIYSSSEAKTQKRLFLTIDGPTAEWVNEYQVLLRIKTSEIMSKLKFNLLLYQDNYMCKMKQNWQIQLFSYEGVYAVSRHDEKTKFKISVPEHILLEMRPSRIDFYSSCPDLIIQKQRIQGSRLARGSVQNWCELLPIKATTQSIQITCVSQKRQLLYGWIVHIYPYATKTF